MALIPARTKYRRVHRLPYEGRAKGNTEIHFGEYGLQARDGAWINTNQISTSRRTSLLRVSRIRLSCLYLRTRG